MDREEDNEYDEMMTCRHVLSSVDFEKLGDIHRSLTIMCPLYKVQTSSLPDY